MNRLAALTFLAPVMMLLTGGTARPQQARQIEALSARADLGTFVQDLRRGVSAQLESRSGAGDKPPYKITVTLPFGFSTNPAREHNGHKDSFYGTPDVNVEYKERSGPLEFYANFDASVARYVSANFASGDALSGQLKLKYVGDDDQAPLPYLSYAPRGDWAPGFLHTGIATHDFSLGFDKTFKFTHSSSGTGWEQLPRSANSGDAPLSLNLPFAFQRRLQLPGAGSYAIVAKPGILFNFATDEGNWAVTASAKITRRWYDLSGRTSRSEWTVYPLVNIGFKAKTDENSGPLGQLYRAMRSPVIQVELGDLDQTSNITAKSYRQAHIAAIAVLSWP